jgi:two-component system, NarL family, sensor histidine kinase EvgS
LPDNFINPENILFEKATILVVDDIEINRRYIKDVFKNSKIKIIEASSGKIGLKKAEEIIPDLIISDIRMPEMDGFEFLDLMKQNINLRQIPVIAYSASVMKEQKKRIYESGFASLLTKPVLLDELINEICKYLPYQLKQPELHDYIESKENITDLEGLIQTFENQFTSNWTALKKRQPIGEIKEFSKNIIAAGKLHNANFIIRYGEEMLNAAENFNIDKVLTLLKEYPKLIKNLNNLWKP